MVQACLPLWLLASSAIAQTVPDPTRPPDLISAVSRDPAASSAADPVLQSILISPGRRMAIISGQTVQLHEKFGDSRLTHIGETEVILRNSTTEQTLKLFPEIKVRPVLQPVRKSTNQRVR
ncbi:MAG: MSHA biogenesis protein MshK [Glaciimonas sp.]|nr:MSHA biogenesis protein MshK [Glaciimonas sp.]